MSNSPQYHGKQLWWMKNSFHGGETVHYNRPEQDHSLGDGQIFDSVQSGEEFTKAKTVNLTDTTKAF